MTEQKETVVQVETLDEYRAVLKKWFSKGYFWYDGGDQDPHEEYLTHNGARYLILEGNNTISYSNGTYVKSHNLGAITFKEFLAKEGKVTYSPISIGGIPERERDTVTYEVSEEQLAFLHRTRENQYPATYLIWFSEKYMSLFSGYEYTEEFERDLLKYVSGDDNVVFKVKEPLYTLKGKDSDGDTVYFTLEENGAPTFTFEESDAFKAPRDEIVRWENSFWKVEPVDA